MHTRGSDVKHMKRNIMPYAVRIASRWHAPNVIILVAKHSKVKLNLYSTFRGNIIIDYHTTQYSLKLCCVLYIYFTFLVAYLAFYYNYNFISIWYLTHSANKSISGVS